MCGITGLVHLDGRPVDERELRALTARVAHRGPDGEGHHVDGAVGLGHRRLTVIGLDDGAQPLFNEDGRVAVTYNGEIYNYRELRRELEGLGHRFRTGTDTEVLVHGYEAWGDDVVHHLRGMFAFAIWDAHRRRILLARDRVGIKPLHYLRDGARFAFASEMGAFEALDDFSPTLDRQALDLYLHLQYIPAPWSIHREVRKLPPAHRMVIDLEGGRVGEPERYWEPSFEPEESLDEDGWIERLDAALSDAVDSHLVADVPVGAFLSGGVDSSTVVGYMSEANGGPVRTFTVGFEDGEYDERGAAREVATTLGTEHHERVARLDAIEILPELVRHYGEPFADSSAVATWIVSRVARERVKVVLSGDGGDELFAGYSYFPKLVRRHELRGGAARRLRRAVGDAGRSVGLLDPLPSLERSWYGRTPYFGDEERRRLWKDDPDPLLEGTRAWNDRQFGRASSDDVLSRCQAVDLTTYLPYDNLTKVDVASMAHGLEVRVPLLDCELVETATRIPWRMRIGMHRNGAGPGGGDGPDVVGKYLLRRTAGRFFRPGFFDRPKMGFSMPVGRWLGGSFRPELEARLTDRAADLGELFDLSTVRSLVREHGEGGRNHGFRLWSLLFLAEWRARSGP